MEWKLSDDRPIYLQLYEQLTRRIVSGIYPPGSKLPPVRELQLQPSGGRRQPADADVDRPPPAVQPAFPADEAAGDGRGAGKRRGI